MKSMKKSLIAACAVFSCVGVANAANDFTDVSAAFAAQFTTVNSQLNKANIALESARYLDFNVNAAVSAEETAFTNYENAVDSLAAGTGSVSIADAVSQYKAAYAAYETSLDAEESSASDVSATFTSAGLATTEVGRTRDVFADALKTIISARDAAKLLKQADVTGVTQAQVDDAQTVMVFDDTLDSEAYSTASGIAADKVEVNNNESPVDLIVTAELVENLPDEGGAVIAADGLYNGSPAVTLTNNDLTAIEAAHEANIKVAAWNANGGEAITDDHITDATARYEAGVIEDITQDDIADITTLLIAGSISQGQINTAKVDAAKFVVTDAEHGTATTDYADSVVTDTDHLEVIDDGSDDGPYIVINESSADKAQLIVDADASGYIAGFRTGVGVEIDADDLTVTPAEAQKIVTAWENKQIIDNGIITQDKINKAIITAARTIVTGDDLIEARALIKSGVINVLTQAEYDAAQTLVSDMAGINTASDAFLEAEADLIEAIKNSDDAAIKAASKALKSVTAAVKDAIFFNKKVTDAINAVNASTMSVKHFNEKIKPDVGVAMSGAMSGVTVVNNTIVNHQNTMVASSGKYGLVKHSGVNAGSASLDMGVWLKAFGSDSEMDMRDGIAGYDADTHGVVIGVDQTIGNDLIVGIALSFAGTDVEGKSTARSMTDTDQIQGTLYGTLFMDDFFINGSLAYAHSSSDTERTGFGGVITGEYDTSTYSVSLGAGMPIDMGSYGITPQVTLAYSYVNPDAYTESGFGALNVNPDSMDLFGVKAGVTINKKLIFDAGTLSPKLRLIADWDVLQEKALVNSSWVSTGTTITPISGSEPAALGGIFGAGVDYASNDGLYVLSLEYDLSTRSDFVSHAASAQFRLNF